MAERFLVEAYTRRQVFLQRLANGMWEELRPTLGRILEEIETRIRLADTEIRQHNLTQLLRDLQQAIDEGKAEFDEGLRERLVEFAEEEIDFAEQTYSQVVTEPLQRPEQASIAPLVAGATAGIAIGAATQRMTNSQMSTRLFSPMGKDIRSTVSNGIISRIAFGQLLTRVRQKLGTKLPNQARTVVATSLNNVSTAARAAFVTANGLIFGEERYVAVLDTRTTLRCAGLDGEIFPVQTGPQPPIHYNCRSTRVPIPRSRFIDPQAANLAAGRNQTFSQFLSSQPQSFRDEFFSKFTNGAELQSLAEQGGLNVNQLIDPSGVQMSLTELRQKYPIAWEQANI